MNAWNMPLLTELENILGMGGYKDFAPDGADHGRRAVFAKSVCTLINDLTLGWTAISVPPRVIS